MCSHQEHPTRQDGRGEGARSSHPGGALSLSHFKMSLVEAPSKKGKIGKGRRRSDSDGGQDQSSMCIMPTPGTTTVRRLKRTKLSGRRRKRVKLKTGRLNRRGRGIEGQECFLIPPPPCSSAETTATSRLARTRSTRRDAPRIILGGWGLSLAYFSLRRRRLLTGPGGQR